MKASDLFVSALENEGVEYIFGIPGEENLDLLESLRRSSIQLILTRHEQGAAFMAATYGRLTGKPGVCLSTLGPGATNLVTPAAYAQLGGMPLVMITGQKPIKTSKQGRFQIIDVVEMMKPITKYTRQLVNGANIPSVVREAFRVAAEEKPGAVHLELPEDIACEDLGYQVIKSSEVRRPSADSKIIDSAVKMIEKATSPLILVGAGGNRKRTGDALLNLIEKTKIPFFNTQMGSGVVDERNPYYIGTAALSDNDYIHCAIDKADLIVNVGHDVVEKPPFFMGEDKAKVIHVNFSTAEVDPVYFPQLEVVGDIANSLNDIAEKITPQPTWKLEYFQKVKREVEKHIEEDAADTSFPIHPARVVADVRKVMPEDGVIALDNGMYKIWFARNYKAYGPNTVLLDNALATMGAGLPSAMAASLLYPKTPVMAICGDGGFMMNSQEIETAMRLGLNITVAIINDSGYGMIKWKQEAMHFKDYGLDFNNPDYIKYAEAYGAKGYKINATEDLIPTLQKCIEDGGVNIVDIPVNYTVNKTELIDELKNKTCILLD